MKELIYTVIPLVLGVTFVSHSTNNTESNWSILWGIIGGALLGLYVAVMHRRTER